MNDCDPVITSSFARGRLDAAGTPAIAAKDKGRCSKARAGKRLTGVLYWPCTAFSAQSTIKNMATSNNDDAFKRIENDYEDFMEGVKRCETEEFGPAKYKDAYERLSRLRDRYILHEKTNLNTAVCKALSKVFEHDKFVEGVMDLRQVVAHVKKRKNGGRKCLTLVTERNAPIPLDVETSAGAVFKARIVYLSRDDGRQEKIDHLKLLAELKKGKQSNSEC